MASHVLEHIYDLPACMATLGQALQPDGFILAEVPDEMATSYQSEPPILDYVAQHVNHFAPFHLDLLFHRYQFSRVSGIQTEFNGGHCYRALYHRDGYVGMWQRSKRTVEGNMKKKAEQLAKIETPVIVWGCSNPVWHLLSLAQFPIAYFVDKDTKAYPPGSSIRGISVYPSVRSDEPILVVAQGQRSAILDNIKELGLKNKVIEV